ncbi:GR28B protein, partial [Acromyrmex insinuator]
MWMLFHATDFQSLMYPNFIISKILGIFPYKIKASSFETSKPRYILWIVILCVICVYELKMLYELNLNLSAKRKIDVPRIISLNISFLYGLFLAVISYIYSGPRMRLLQTISDISLRLPKKSYQKLSKLIHAKDIFGFFFHFWLALTLYFLYTEKNVFGLFDIFRVFINLLGFQMDMLYINCVCVLKTCFKEINNNLRELMINNLRKIYHEQRNPFLLIKLKALKKQHLMISDTVQMLNMIFSLHLLATIALSFKQIIFYVYSNVIQWQNGISLNQDEIDNAYFISVLIYYFTRLILIIWACETSKNEAIKIGTTIHDILNGISDVQIKDELNLFSLQILHCDNTFSAKGLTVDATLLTAEINDNLENLQERMINNISKRIYHEQRHSFLLIKLKAMKKQHLMISDTVQMLNIIFSLHLLATITLYFKQIIFYLYFNVIHWQNGISLNREKIYNIYFISFLIYYFIKLILIVWACETGKNEAIKTGTTIHDVLNSISDVQIKDELNLFSLQILHCNNTFSVKGLTIDATLLTTVIVFLSTYLLILIQFLIMAHSCDSKTKAI